MLFPALAPVSVQLGQALAKILAMTDLGEERVLQRRERRLLGRMLRDHAEQVPDHVEPAHPRERMVVRLDVPLTHESDEPVEHRQQDVFLSVEVVSKLPTAHLDAFLDLREREVLNPLLRDDRNRRVHHLLAPNLCYARCHPGYSIVFNARRSALSPARAARHAAWRVMSLQKSNVYNSVRRRRESHAWQF